MPLRCLGAWGLRCPAVSVLPKPPRAHTSKTLSCSASPAQLGTQDQATSKLLTHRSFQNCLGSGGWIKLGIRGPTPPHPSAASRTLCRGCTRGCALRARLRARVGRCLELRLRSMGEAGGPSGQRTCAVAAEEAEGAEKRAEAGAMPLTWQSVRLCRPVAPSQTLMPKQRTCLKSYDIGKRQGLGTLLGLRLRCDSCAPPPAAC